MASRVRRARPSPTRSRVRATPAAGSYQRSRAAVVLGIFILVFGFFWIVNGDFTATMVMALFRTTVEWGWAAHLLMSAIEVGPVFLRPFFQKVPRSVLVVMWLLSLPFGVFDVFSSAVGIGPWFIWTGAAGVGADLQNTALAELVAFLPEPMILWLLVALRNVLRG